VNVKQGNRTLNAEAPDLRPALSFVDSTDWIWQSLAAKVQERKQEKLTAPFRWLFLKSDSPIEQIPLAGGPRSADRRFEGGKESYESQL
jgi:hypothetical protein